MAFLWLLPWLVIFGVSLTVLKLLKRVELRHGLIMLMASILAWGFPLLLSLTPLSGAYMGALHHCIDTNRALNAR